MLTKVSSQNPLQVRRLPRTPTLVIGLGQPFQPHQQIDSADVTFGRQNLAGGGFDFLRQFGSIHRWQTKSLLIVPPVLAQDNRVRWCLATTGPPGQASRCSIRTPVRTRKVAGSRQNPAPPCCGTQWNRKPISGAQRIAGGVRSRRQGVRLLFTQPGMTAPNPSRNRR